MKPLNLDNRPCSPISSNCVIWQGPDIPCIKLCAGDTVSDVIFKLATELCTIIDQLNVSNYDLSCLNLTVCPPEDFQALIQLLITRICELNDIPPTEPGKTLGCPDCVVSVAPCLIQNGQTTMQLVDYVQMIADRLCGIISEISDINNQISTINSTLVDLQFQIDNLPTYTLPSFTVDCILSGNQPLDVIVQTLMNDNALGYCALIGSTGTPADINAAVLSQCITDIDQPLAALPAVNTFSAYYSGSWVNAATLGAEPTVANAINNIWIAVCDIYNYVKDLSLSVQDTNSVNLTYTGGVLKADIQDTGWKDLDGFAFYTGAMASNKPQCRRIGNQIHFRGAVYVPINNGAGAPVLLTGANTYNNVYRVNPYVGAGGVIYDAESRILFNNTGAAAASVIPATVLDAGTNLDSSYSVPQLVATRKLDVETFVGSGITGATQLTAAINVTILPNKTLRLSSLNVIEQEPTDLAPFIGSSLLNGLTSNFTPRSWIINQRNHVRQIDGNMSLDQSPITGLLGSGIVIGELYRIINYTPGDDFTNIGALLNADNQTFIATGTTPTVWTGSQLIPLSSALHYDSFYNTLGPGYTGSQWPFLIDLATPDFDAARTNNLGGFIFRLDGLMAYVDPCTTDIKNYNCP